MNLKLTDKESILYQLAFKPLSIINYKKILKAAEWDSVAEGANLVEEGVVIDRLMMIYSGIARVEADGKTVAYLGDGNFVGEMSFITNKKTSAAVTANTGLEFLFWNKENLKNLMEKSKEIEEGFRTIFNVDLVKKLSKNKS